MLRRSSCVVGSVMLALLAGSVRAETIYIDQQARPANGADVVLDSGPFEVRRRERVSAERTSFELVNVVAGADFQAAGSDGLGADLGPHQDVSLADVVKWSGENGLPDRVFYVALDAVPPAGSEATTVVVRRFSVRLAGRLFVLPDELVIESRPDMVGEVVLRLEPGFAMSERQTPDPASFRASVDMAAPPGTALVAFATSVPKEIVFSDVGKQQQPGSGAPQMLPVLSSERHGFQFAGRTGSGTVAAASYVSASSSTAFQQEGTITPVKAVTRSTSSAATDSEDDDESLAPDDVVVDEEVPDEAPTPIDPPDGPQPQPVDPDPTPDPPDDPPEPPPVPEPASLTLLAVGLAWLGGQPRRRRR